MKNASMEGPRVKYMVMMDLRRSIFSIRFLLAIFFFLSWMTMNIAYDLIEYNNLSESSTVYLLRNALDGSNLGPMMLVIATIPFSTMYLYEKDSGFLEEIQKRVGIYTYSISKVIVTFISDFLVALISIIVFLALMTFLGIPHTLHNESLAVYYEEISLSEGVIWYYSVKITIAGFVCGLAGVFSLFVSSYIANAYAAILSPVIAYYLWNSILNMVYSLFPANLIWSMVSPYNLFFAQVWLGNSLLSFLWTILLIALLISLVSICFVKKTCTEAIL